MTNLFLVHSDVNYRIKQIPYFCYLVAVLHSAYQLVMQCSVC